MAARNQSPASVVGWLRAPSGGQPVTSTWTSSPSRVATRSCAGPTACAARIVPPRRVSQPATAAATFWVRDQPWSTSRVGISTTSVLVPAPAAAPPARPSARAAPSGPWPRGRTAGSAAGARRGRRRRARTGGCGPRRRTGVFARRRGRRDGARTSAGSGSSAGSSTAMSSVAGLLDGGLPDCWLLRRGDAGGGAPDGGSGVRSGRLLGRGLGRHRLGGRLGDRRLGGGGGP